MTADDILSLVASAAFLGLASLAMFRGAQNPLAWPLGLLCADVFAYNTLEFLGSLTGGVIWEWLKAFSAALAAPLMLHFVFSFLGVRRAQRAALIVAYLYFGALALASLMPFAFPSLSAFPNGPSWALFMLVGMAPVFGWAAWLTSRHYRKYTSGKERGRTLLFVGTVVLGVGGAAVDLGGIASGSGFPRVAPVGMVSSALLLAALSFRVAAVRGSTGLLVLNGLVLGAIGVLAQLSVFYWLGGGTALFVLGSVVVLLLVLGGARQVFGTLAAHRARTAHLTTLGRLSAQMAHDIRNPLAAIRGAAQLIEGELEGGGSLANQREMVALIVGQADRLERVIGDYQRMGRAEAIRREQRVAPILESVADAARASSTSEIALTLLVDDAIESFALDADLIQGALENLVRNAVEALGEGGGEIRLEAHQSPTGIALVVRDDGPGMDARTRERALEGLFTTKASGTGLGLAFARRVAEAHDGRLHLESAPSRGTLVRLELSR